MYTIDVIVNTNTVRRYKTDDKGEAKRIYYSNEDNPHQYTQFAIDGRPLTTARAKAYLGTNKERQIVL